MDRVSGQRRLVRRITAVTAAGALAVAGGIVLIAANGQSQTTTGTPASDTLSGTSSDTSANGLQQAGQPPSGSTGQGVVVSGGS
jgi:hypothetical protein